MPSSSPARLRLGRRARLKQSRDFARARQEGQRRARGCLVANWRALPAGALTRLGVVTGRKIGNAVARSRARRLLRESFRVHQHELLRPLDLVLVARVSIIGKKRNGVELDLLAVLRQAGLLKTTE